MTTHDPGTTMLTRDGQIWMLTLTGDHDLTTTRGLDEEMERIAASGTSVVIDLSGATFIDSQVIAWLVRWWRRSLESTHLHLAISTGEAASPVTRLFDLVKLADTLPCHSTREAALHHLGAAREAGDPPG